MQGGNGTRHLALSPQFVDQAVAKQRDSARHQEQGEEGTLTATGKRHRLTLALEDERPQDPESPDALGHGCRVLPAPGGSATMRAT